MHSWRSRIPTWENVDSTNPRKPRVNGKPFLTMNCKNLGNAEESDTARRSWCIDLSYFCWHVLCARAAVGIRHTSCICDPLSQSNVRQLLDPQPTFLTWYIQLVITHWQASLALSIWGLDFLGGLSIQAWVFLGMLRGTTQVHFWVVYRVMYSGVP